MKTVHANKNTVNRRWLLVDAKDVVLGRMASEVASLLRGKRSPNYTPHVDCGDFVVVVNASKLKLTGKKLDDKKYYDYSGYFGGMRETTARTMLERKPTEVVRRAVKGMLPKGRLGNQMLTKLKVYEGTDHPHQAQKPEKIEFEGKK